MDFRLTYGALDLCDYPFSLEFGADLGAPQNVSEALAFLLQDGEIELSSRASNRTITFTVLMEGADLAALADAEAALILETEKPLNTLTVDPGDGFGVPTVFEVFRGQVALVRDDNFELAGYRRYSVTVRALPFVRSAEEVVAVAEKPGTAITPPAVVTTNVYTAGSATGWSGYYYRLRDNGAQTNAGPSSVFIGDTDLVSVTPPYVFPLNLAYPDSVQVDAARAVSVGVTATKQLSVTWRWDAVIGSSPDANVSSTDLRVLVNEDTGSGVFLRRIGGSVSPPRMQYATTTFEIPAGMSALSYLHFANTLKTPWLTVGSPQQQSLHIKSVEVSNANRASGSPRQLLRTIDVAGSARTQGRLAIEHEVSALGDVLAYVWPVVEGSTYSPPLRQYRTDGPGVSPDSAAVSGAHETLATAGTADTPTTWNIPTSALVTGSHALMVRVAGSSGLLTYTAQSMIAGTAIGSPQVGVVPMTLAAGFGSGDVYCLGRLQLPDRDFATGGLSSVRITLASEVGKTVILDEAWLFNTTIGRLTHVRCGWGTPSAAGPSNRAWIAPATVTTPRPTVRVGNSPTGADSFYPSVVGSWQEPQFVPPVVNVFTVTTTALDARVTLRHYPRWHTHAAI